MRTRSAVLMAFCAIVAACASPYHRDVELICSSPGEDLRPQLKSQEGIDLWNFFVNHGRTENAARLREAVTKEGIAPCRRLEQMEAPAPAPSSS